jgi:CubicO group peptidase (beta-lactamase class C family)
MDDGGVAIGGFGAERLGEAVGALVAGCRAGHHLGAQLYVSRDHAPVCDLALGEAAPGEPLTRGHLMLWLSSTKPVAAVAVAQLWERGALELDDPVARHVPEFAQGGKEAVTVRHLLTHTGGFRLLDVGWPDHPWEETLARICAVRLEPRWVPGEKAGYHLVSSWFVLGELVRRLDGRAFDRYVRDEVFAPLGMADSWVGMPADACRAYGSRVAEIFDTGAGAPRPRGWAAEARAVRPSPGGNGRGPIAELGRFYEALLAGGARGGRRVLKPQTVEALTARHRVGMFDHTFRHVLDWGLGFIPDSKHYGADTVPYGYGRLCSARTWGHSGYRSSTAFADADRRLVVALAMNGTPTAEVHERRLQGVIEGIYRDLGLGGPPPPSAGPASARTG